MIRWPETNLRELREFLLPKGQNNPGVRETETYALAAPPQLPLSASLPRPGPAAGLLAPPPRPGAARGLPQLSQQVGSTLHKWLAAPHAREAELKAQVCSAAGTLIRQAIDAQGRGNLDEVYDLLLGARASCAGGGVNFLDVAQRPWPVLSAVASCLINVDARALKLVTGSPQEALRAAFNDRNGAMLTALLDDEDIDIDTPINALGQTMFSVASQQGDLPTIKQLQKRGASALVRDLHGLTALDAALDGLSMANAVGCAEAIKQIVKGGADPNAPHGRRGDTPLMIACQAKATDLAVWLLDDAKADVHARAPRKGAPFSMSTQSNFETAFDVVAALAPSWACGAVLRALARAGLHMESRAAGSSATPLMVAASLGDSALADEMVRRGADLRAKDTRDRNAAHRAEAQGFRRLAADLDPSSRLYIAKLAFGPT